MDERMQFVARRLAGEPMAELCREFGVSRKTGDKIFDRYQECGIQGPPEVGVRIATGISASTRAGVPARSESGSSADSPESRSPARAPSLRCSIAMACSNAAVVCVVVREALPSP
jgi:Homeodomain-like domain